MNEAKQAEAALENEDKLVQSVQEASKTELDMSEINLSSVESRDALTEAILQLKDAGKTQVAQLKKQLWYTRLTAFCMAGILAVVFASAMALLPSVGRTVTRAEQVLSELKPAVESIAQADIAGTLKNADALITESREGLAEGLASLEETQKKIEAFDVQTLNNAIKELDSIIRPLANLFGK